jgi:hypothetical protein
MVVQDPLPEEVGRCLTGAGSPSEITWGMRPVEVRMGDAPPEEP